MTKRIALLCAALFYAGTALAQFGANCGEHPNVLRDKSGIVWFTPEQLDKMTTRRIEPAMPRLSSVSHSVSHYDGYVTFKILVDTKGDIACIWAGSGKPEFVRAVNEALQYWRYTPMRVNGKPVEFVGVVKFNVAAN
jgi:hypothetical protein